MERYGEPILVKMKKSAKRILKSLAVGRLIYPVVQKAYRSYAIPMRRRRLHKFGYDVVGRLHSVLTKNNIPYYCDAGTLLGFIRDNGFIKHDDDIDICIIPGAVTMAHVLKSFLDAGYGYIHGFDYKGRFLEFSVMDPANISIDVFMHKPCDDDPRFLHEIFLRWYPDESYPDERANSALLFRFRGPDGLKLIRIHGVDVSIPLNAEEVLDSEYGPWRKPDPDFKSDQIRHERLPGFAFRMTEEEALSHA